jgi:hypothetical protein
MDYAKGRSWRTNRLNFRETADRAKLLVVAS